MSWSELGYRLNWMWIWDVCSFNKKVDQILHSILKLQLCPFLFEFEMQAQCFLIRTKSNNKLQIDG